jgi:hypothetical protein
MNQPKGVKPKMRENKLRSGVNWQGTLEQKGVKQGLVVFNYFGTRTFKTLVGKGLFPIFLG